MSTRQNFFFALLAFIALGCSSGGGGGSSPTGPSGSAPGISNLQYSPHSATVGQGGGAVTVTGTIDFIDLDGNVNMIDMSVQDAGTYAVVDTLHISVDTAGHTSGTLYFAVQAYTNATKNYIFAINVRDTSDLHSNPLSGTFTVN